MTPIQRRLTTPLEPIEEPGYLHTVLAQCGMPRRKVNGDTYERTNGRASLLMKAGELWDDRTGTWEPQPLPYGTRPRLALIYISAEAVRTGLPEVEVGHSVRDFLRRLGININGPEHTNFQRQMRALAACEMRLGMGTDTIMDAAPIKRFRAWHAGAEGQRSLWPGTVTLTRDFFDSLREAAVPLDMGAVARLKHSALALDVYAWLAHRLHRVRAPTGDRVSWLALQAQFGEYRNVKDFRREAIEALAAVQAVYPAARVESVRGGLRLLPSPPPVPKR
ncbi:RepA protein, partial [Belnapia rosea]